jgi:hypothetical protein
VAKLQAAYKHTQQQQPLCCAQKTKQNQKKNPNFHSSSKNEYELLSFRVNTFQPCLAAGSHGEGWARAVEMKTRNVLGRRKKARFEATSLDAN